MQLSSQQTMLDQWVIFNVAYMTYSVLPHFAVHVDKITDEIKWKPNFLYIYIYVFFREKLLRQWFPDLKPSIPLTFNGTILDYFGDKTLGGHYGIAYY